MPPFRLLVPLSRSPRLYIVGFGLSLLVVGWIAITKLIAQEQAYGRRAIEDEVSNLALVIDQNVVRSIGEVDRILLTLRKRYELSGPATDWVALFSDELTLNDERVQLAVIDAEGFLLTSTAMPRPTVRIDLRDREHFQVHRDSPFDRVFISKPVLGRATGKWTLQVTRRLSTPDGAFAGVIVLSLDPKHLARIYGGLSLGNDGGLAVIGLDGVVRAGTGIYAGSLGRGFVEGVIEVSSINDTGKARVSRENYLGRKQITAVRRNVGHGLEIAVAKPDLESLPDWRRRKASLLQMGVAFSTLVVAMMLVASISRRNHDEKIGRMAREDALTLLSNRAGLNETLDSRLAASRSAGSGPALLLLDLDRFKIINDSYGHPFGDRLLRIVADRLRSSVKSTDVVARLGGDEFAIVQQVVPTPEQAGALAERISRIVCAPIEIDGITVEVGVSIGIAFTTPDCTTAAALMRAADLALYAAKTDGKGRHRFYSHGLLEADQRRRELENDLRLAVERQELELHYQPITSLASKRITAYEALVRWRHPKRGLVPPVEFIPLAEETGLIVKIGEWVLRKACAHIAGQAQHVSVAVNISAIQFQDPYLVDQIQAALAGAGVRPDRLEIEITESALMSLDQRTMHHLARLRNLGVRVAIDDFGTGYSSFSYLQSYPINSIKIDRSFINALGNDANAATIVRSITMLAKGLNMSTVAEGVETRQQLELLETLGCTEAQGYYLGRPLPASPSVRVADAEPLLAAGPLPRLAAVAS